MTREFNIPMHPRLTDQQVQDILHTHTVVTDAGTPAALLRIEGDAICVFHAIQPSRSRHTPQARAAAWSAGLARNGVRAMVSYFAASTCDTHGQRRSRRLGRCGLRSGVKPRLDAARRQLGILLGVGLAVAFTGLSAWLAWEFRPRAVDPATRSYRRFVARLARRGLVREPWEAPRDFLERVRRFRPDLEREARAITELYLRVRYSPAPGERDLDRLRGLVGHFRP